MLNSKWHLGHTWDIGITPYFFVYFSAKRFQRIILSVNNSKASPDFSPEREARACRFPEIQGFDWAQPSGARKTKRAGALGRSSSPLSECNAVDSGRCAVTAVSWWEIRAKVRPSGLEHNGKPKLCRFNYKRDHPTRGSAPDGKPILLRTKGRQALYSET